MQKNAVTPPMIFHGTELTYRIGQGFDVHAFADGDHVMLGGSRIPHDRGLDAHSDGDVALHSLCDALLGAVALGDIGHHFPPGDDQWRNISSRTMLSNVNELVAENGYSVVNVDLTIVCERPRLAQYIRSMRLNIAEDLDCDAGCVSVKATTTEKLGFCGRGEGIAAQAIVLVTHS